VIPRPDNPLIVALDVSEIDAAEAMARRLDGEAGILKVGLELFAAHGPEAVSRMRAFAPVFLDVKLHDIPTTVQGGLDVHWVSGLGVTPGQWARRTGNPRRMASPRFKSTNGGSPPARGRGGRSSDLAENHVVPAPDSGQTDCPRLR
jgi:hypothetical protein